MQLYCEKKKYGAVDAMQIQTKCCVCSAATFSFKLYYSSLKSRQQQQQHLSYLSCKNKKEAQYSELLKNQWLWEFSPIWHIKMEKLITEELQGQ